MKGEVITKWLKKLVLYWHFVDLVWVFVFTFFYLGIILLKMGNSTHKLEIFRGLVKFKSNQSKIWASPCFFYPYSNYH